MASPMPQVAGVEHRDVLVRGLRTHVATAGPEDGAPVLLVHGWPQHWYEWRNQFAPLADAGYRVIAPDYRGFGWTEFPPDEDFLKETIVDDLIALCSELGLERVSYVGHDWGCWAGWLLCLRRPDLVDRAVLMSAPPPFAPDRIEPAALLRLPRLAYQLPIAAPLPELLKSRFFRRMGDVFGGLTEAEIEAFAVPLAQPSQVRASTLLYRQFLLHELPGLLARRYRGQRVELPVLFMVGDRDLLFYEELVEEPAQHCDDYRGEVLRGVGHFVPEEAAELVNERLLSFLRPPAPQGHAAIHR